MYIDWEAVFNEEPREFTQEERDAAFSYKTCAVGFCHPDLVKEDKDDTLNNFYELKDNVDNKFFKAGGEFFGILNRLDDAEHLSDVELFIKAKGHFNYIKAMR